MGQGESKEKESSILQVFTTEERANVHKLYKHIVGDRPHMTEPFLLKYLPAWFSLRHSVWKVLCECETNAGQIKEFRVAEQHFGSFLAQCLKGTSTEKADILCLFCGQLSGQVNTVELYKVIFAIVQCYFGTSKGDRPLASWKCSVTNDDISRLCYSFSPLENVSSGDKSERISQYDVEKWLSHCPFFQRMFDRVFFTLFQVLANDAIPEVCQSFLPTVTNVDWSKTSTILDTLSISFLNYHLPRGHQLIWRLMYSNMLHGDSFAQLMRFIVGKGPNVLIVRDKEGHVFGGFVSQSWEMGPSFYGENDCFLFSLSPRYGVYTSTSYNSNFMYLNQGQETLPNGLGMGGQLDYFGLWIDFSFNNGHSKAGPKCTTYGSPQLSGSPEFVVESLEVWAVGPEKKKDDDDEPAPSILDVDVGAKAILELAGKKQHSEGIRDLCEDEKPMTEEEKRKMNTIPKLL